MSDNRDFDPRFNPAFQRGYEGVAETPAPATRPVITPPPTSRPATTPPVGRTTTPSLGRVEPEPLARPSRDFDFTEVEIERDAPRSRNPFIIVLAVIAVVVTGAGLVLFSRLGAIFADTQSSAGFDYVSFQVLVIAAPLLVCLGLATGIGLLFVLAVRWGSR